jgi:hypothetical protein
MPLDQGPQSSSPRFGKANFKPDAPTPTECLACRAPLSEFFTINGGSACPACTRMLQGKFSGPFDATKFVKAAIFGVVGAVAGALVFWGVRRLTGYEVGLISIFVGWLVGRLVRKGADSRGGLPYQLLAVVLTYTSIVSSYIPHLIEEGKFEVGLLPILFVVPFLEPAKNLIGLIIIGIGLFEAWRTNRAVKLDVSGPHFIPSAVIDVMPQSPSGSAAAAIVPPLPSRFGPRESGGNSSDTSGTSSL